MTNRRLSTLALVAAAGAALSGEALAQVGYTWNGTFSNRWDIAENWSPVGVPGLNVTPDSAELDAPLPSIVVHAGIANLFTMSLSPSIELTTFESAYWNMYQTGIFPAIENNGLLIVGNGVGAAEYINFFDGLCVITGTGTLRLNTGEGAPCYLLQASATSSIVNDAGHTIAGSGDLYGSGAGFVNNGTILADDLGGQLQVLGSMTNNDRIAAIGGGSLFFTSAAITQSASGTISAETGNVEIASGSVRGGTLSASSGQSVAFRAGTATEIEDVRLSGPVVLGSTGRLALTNTLTNNGVLTLSTSSAVARFTSSLPAVIAGTGQMVMDNALIDEGYGANGPIAHSAGHTIIGSGTISAPIDNSGAIVANDAALSLTITSPVENAGVLQASSGASLLVNGSVNQSSTGRIRADGGTVDISSFVQGGQIEAVAPDVVRPLTGARMNNATLTGTIFVEDFVNTTMGSDTTPGGVITNNGTILFDTPDLFPSVLAFIGFATNTTINGTGVIEASIANRGDFVAGLLGAGSGATVTYGAGQTLRGELNFDGSHVVLGTISPGNDAQAVSQFYLGYSAPTSMIVSGSATTEIDIASPTSFDRLQGTAQIILDGTLVVRAGGAPISSADRFPIVTGSAIGGRFRNVSAPGFPAFGPPHVRYTPTSATLIACYANCDGSTEIPVLNALDFSCFLNRFRANDGYANCDGSTTIPTLNALDFACYLTKFRSGC